MPADFELTAHAAVLRTSHPFVISSAWRSVPQRILRGLGIPTRIHVAHVWLHDGKFTGRGEGRPSSRWGETMDSALTALRGCAGNVDVLPLNERAARAALDSALLDLEAQRAGAPLWKHLGLKRGGPPTSFTISLGDPDAMARAAERAAPRFRVLKLKLGGGDGLDAERVWAVCRATTLPLRVDANEGWRFEEAAEILPQLPPHRVEFVEQPLRAGDPDGERLRGQSALPIFVDEDCRTVEDIPACARIAHGVNIKLSKCGGIREALRCVAAARAAGLQTMIGCMIESSLGIAAAAHISSAFDFADIDSNLLLDRDPFSGVTLENGVQMPSDAPGLGLR